MMIAAAKMVGERKAQAGGEGRPRDCLLKVLLFHLLLTSSTIPLVRCDTILLEGKRVALTQKTNAVAQCRSAGIKVGSEIALDICTST